MKRMLVGFSILVIFMFPFSTVAKAENDVIDFEGMSQYGGYLEAFYEAYATNSAYLSAKYTDNLGYIDGIIGQLKENARFLVKEFINDECTQSTDCNWAIDFYKKLVAGGATALDFIRGFFANEEETFSNVDDSWYNRYINWTSNLSVSPKEGYEFVVIDFLGVEHVVLPGVGLSAMSNSGRAYAMIGTTDIAVKSGVTYAESWGLLSENERSFSYFHSALVKLGVSFGIKSTSEQYPIEPTANPNYSAINNYIQNNSNVVSTGYKPQINAQLVCPSTSSGLDIVGSLLKLNDFVLDVDKNTGQTVFNGETCMVNFTPTMPEIAQDGRIIVVNSDGQKIDLETNLPVSSGASGIDYSLVDYVSNAYNYATTVISSGVNGLRSIIAGTAGLVTFAGSLFGFLPPEVLTLFIGGFSIALGLWVFKK